MAGSRLTWSVQPIWLLLVRLARNTFIKRILKNKTKSMKNNKCILAITIIAGVFSIQCAPILAHQAPKSWAMKSYHNLIYFNEVNKGGHFAQWEQPQLFAEELRAAFKSLR